MTEVMVSIRMPESLVSELNELVEEQHYMDLSELIRSVARQKWIDSSNPELAELKKLQQGIQQDVTEVAQKKIQQQINAELKKIQDQLKSGGMLK